MPHSVYHVNTNCAYTVTRNIVILPPYSAFMLLFQPGSYEGVITENVSMMEPRKGRAAGEQAPRPKGPAGNRRLVRRPRAGFVTPPPGDPGPPSAPTKRGCLQWLHAARTKAERKLAGSGARKVPSAPGRMTPGTEIAAMERREAPASWQQDVRLDGTTGAPLGAPSPRVSRGGRNGNTAYPAPQRIRAMTRASSSFRGASESERTRNPEMQALRRLFLDSGSGPIGPSRNDKENGLFEI